MKLPRVKKERTVLPINHLIPNMLTMLSLCGGLMAIRYAILGKWEHCIYALVVSAILDTLDGRIARMLKATSPFGAELDSLSDLVAFGVAPTFIIYLWSLQETGPLGWIACIVFTCCAALRLARFNVDIGLGSVSDKPPFATRYFTGVPTPAGAGLALLPMILSNALADLEITAHVYRWYTVLIPWMFLVGILMVSRKPKFYVK
jgi:CDP-diacylglycerol---serine O-phosphatidyltransferase